MAFLLNRRMREAIRRYTTSEQDAELFINFFQELVDDSRAVAAKMDLDSGVTDTDYGDIVDDDPTDGQ